MIHRRWIASGFVYLIAHILLPVVARAGPVAPEQIPAEARWFGHLDLDALRSVPGFTDCMSNWCGRAGASADLGRWTENLGLNPMQDLLGITLFSTDYAGGRGVALFHLQKLDRDKLIAVLKQRHPDTTTTNHGERTLYSWTTRSRRGEQQLTGTFANDRLIVIGNGAANVVTALDAFDGKHATHSKEDALFAGVSARPLFVSRGLDVSASDRSQTRCPVLRSCQSAFVQWDQAAGAIAADYRLEADSEEAARAFQTVVDGMQAMVKLRGRNMEAVTGLLQGLNYGADGKVFTLKWKTTVDAIREAIQQAKPPMPASGQ